MPPRTKQALSGANCRILCGTSVAQFCTVRVMTTSLRVAICAVLAAVDLVMLARVVTNVFQDTHRPAVSTPQPAPPPPRLRDLRTTNQSERV